MKKVLNSLIIAMIALAFASCKKENIDYPSNGKEGSVDLSSVIVNYNPTATIVRSGNVDTQNFIISIYERTSNVLKGRWLYKEMPEVVSLPSGSYVINAKSHEPEPAAWDAPYYYADKNFDVEADKVTLIGELLCVLSNVKVSVEFSSDLIAVMGDECKVNIGLGTGSLDFTKDETRSGYFTVKETTNRIYAYFTGPIDGYVDTIYNEIENVKAGEWRILRYALKTPNPNNQESGSFAASLSIDFSCYVVEQNVEVPVNEDVIEDPEPSTPDIPTPPTPITDGPEITATTFDITQPQLVTEDLTIQVNVTSDKPLAGFTVDIESTTLTASELESVGLTTHLDLANPGEFRNKLEGLGFPVAENVVGQTQISFDITPFGTMLSALGAGTHKFIMTATDNENNQTIQTLTLITE